MPEIFEPNDPNELLRGWLLHAHKGRDRHDLAARRCDQRRYWIGVPATVLSAVVGTSTFVALQETVVREVRFIVGALAILSAILIALQSFLDLGARAERHRLAGARYKAVIRELEQRGIGTVDLKMDSEDLDTLRVRLDALEEEMPVVSPRVYEAIEARYRDRHFIDSMRPESAQKASASASTAGVSAAGGATEGTDSPSYSPAPTTAPSTTAGSVASTTTLPSIASAAESV